jgi:hypothetical protein
VVRAIAPAVGDADHVPHDAAAKKANRERLTPALPFAVIPCVRIPATLMAYGAEAGGIVTAIPVLQDGYARLGKKLRSRWHTRAARQART